MTQTHFGSVHWIYRLGENALLRDFWQVARQDIGAAARGWRLSGSLTPMTITQQQWNWLMDVKFLSSPVHIRTILGGLSASDRGAVQAVLPQDMLRALEQAEARSRARQQHSLAGALDLPEEIQPPISRKAIANLTRLRARAAGTAHDVLAMLGALPEGLQRRALDAMPEAVQQKVMLASRVQVAQRGESSLAGAIEDLSIPLADWPQTLGALDSATDVELGSATDVEMEYADEAAFREAMVYLTQNVLPEQVDAGKDRIESASAGAYMQVAMAYVASLQDWIDASQLSAAIAASVPGYSDEASLVSHGWRDDQFPPAMSQAASPEFIWPATADVEMEDLGQEFLGAMTDADHPPSELAASDQRHSVDLPWLVGSHPATSQPDGLDVIQPDGLALGDTEWLNDMHISTGYTALERHLEATDPELAAITRFVPPATAYMLAVHHGAMVETLEGVYLDADGNDTARYVFVPVSNQSHAPDAQAVGGPEGSHWSLLMIDRVQQQAYHYDSSPSLAQDEFATVLTGQMAHGIPTSTRPMALQSNGYDCGVAVLAATRALIGALPTQGAPDVPSLDLNAIDIDRGVVHSLLGGQPNSVVEDRAEEQRAPGGAGERQADPDHRPEIPPSREASVDREIDDVIASASRAKKNRTKAKYLTELRSRVEALNEKRGRSQIDGDAVERRYTKQSAKKRARSPDRADDEDRAVRDLVQRLYDDGVIAENNVAAYTEYRRINRAKELFRKGLIKEPTTAAYSEYLKRRNAQKLHAEGLIDGETTAAYSYYNRTRKAQELFEKRLINEPTAGALERYHKIKRAQRLFEQRLINEPTVQEYDEYHRIKRAKELFAEHRIEEPTASAYRKYMEDTRNDKTVRRQVDRRKKKT
jgi:hypothetical protein